MRFASLGSGSRGNCTVVEYGDQLVLVDCGFSVREFERRFAVIDRSPDQVTAILVTHEHTDHLKGVPALARKYRIPVYMTPGTRRSREMGELPDIRLIRGYSGFELGEIRVQPVAVPHDAREPAQFTFTSAPNGKKLGILTDLGTVSEHVAVHYECCDALLVEANHDTQMLAEGPYPVPLKRRVAGPWGHLNNQQTADFLNRTNSARLHTLVLGHISQQNNCAELVREIVEPAVAGVDVIQYACQDQGFGWLSV